MIQLLNLQPTIPQTAFEETRTTTDAAETGYPGTYVHETEPLVWTTGEQDSGRK